MRIAVYHNLPYGGAMRAMREQISRLGADVEAIYTLAGPAGSPDEQDSRVRSLGVRQFRFRGYPFGRLSPFIALVNLALMDRASKAIARAIDSECYDAVLVHPCRATQTPSVLKYLRTPTVYYCHEVNRGVHEALINGGTLLPWYAPVGMYARRSLIRNELRGLAAASVVLCNSEFVRETILRIYGIDASVNYLGVDTSVFFPVPDSVRENAVISVGALAAHKNQEFIVEAISMIPARTRPVLRVVAGRSMPRAAKRLASLGDRCGVELDMHWDVTDHELRSLYATSKATVYAPLLEPFGLVPLESMACGTPVVAVREGGVRETVVDGVNGMLTSRDAAEFARAVASVIEAPSAAQEMGEAGVAYVREKWTWEKSIRELTCQLERAARQCNG